MTTAIEPAVVIRRLIAAPFSFIFRDPFIRVFLVAFPPLQRDVIIAYALLLTELNLVFLLRHIVENAQWTRICLTYVTEPIVSILVDMALVVNGVWVGCTREFV